jgi:hypothetical protein
MATRSSPVRAPSRRVRRKAPTGKEYAVEHIQIWPVEAGKAIEHWSVRDDPGQALQLS